MALVLILSYRRKASLTEFCVPKKCSCLKESQDCPLPVSNNCGLNPKFRNIFQQIVYNQLNQVTYVQEISEQAKQAPTRFELVISCLLDRRFNQLSHGAVVSGLSPIKILQPVGKGRIGLQLMQQRYLYCIKCYKKNFKN